MARLRKNAEAAYRNGACSLVESAEQTLDDYKVQLHDLNVYRIELEMQNDELQRAYLELEETRDRYADLYDFAPIGYFTLSVECRVVDVNLAGAALLSLSRAELTGRLLTSFALVSDVKTLRNHILDAIATQERQVAEIWLTQKGGVRVLTRFETIAVPGDGQLVRTAVADITEQRLADEMLRTLSLAVEQSPVAVLVTDIDGNIQYANTYFSEMTGYSLDELAGQNPRIQKSGQTTNTEYKQLWDTITSGAQWCGALLNKRKDGTHFWVRSRISGIKDNTGKITHYLAIEEDITLEKIRSEGLERQAAYDHLTGLPNRLLAFDRLEHSLSHMARAKNCIGVMVLDLDHFKHVNDTLGHVAGDQLLVQVGERLSALLRAEDTVARLGGDEFMVILPSVHSIHDVKVIADKITHAFSVPFVLLPQELFCTISIGISLAPKDSCDSQVLLRNADTAMYVAKAEGRNTHRFYVESMCLRAKERLSLATHLRLAVERNELSLVYQPLVNIGSGAVMGAEALMRWKNSELGSVEPGRFIPLAEELGLIVPIGQWLLTTVCYQIRDWLTSGVTVPRIAINVSSRQFREVGFARQVLSLLADYDLGVDCIELEITESLLVGENTIIIQNLYELRQAGIQFSVDDFGTGFSSLSYLQRLSLQCLKIDRSFIANLPESGDASILTKAIIGMAQQLNMTVVAEGVETVEQLQFLKQAGCDIAQGYLFSKGVPAEMFAQTIELIKKNF